MIASSSLNKLNSVNSRYLLSKKKKIEKREKEINDFKKSYILSVSPKINPPNKNINPSNRNFFNKIDLTNKTQYQPSSTSLNKSPITYKNNSPNRLKKIIIYKNQNKFALNYIPKKDISENSPKTNIIKNSPSKEYNNTESDNALKNNNNNNLFLTKKLGLSITKRKGSEDKKVIKLIGCDYDDISEDNNKFENNDNENNNLNENQITLVNYNLEKNQKENEPDSDSENEPEENEQNNFHKIQLYKPNLINNIYSVKVRKKLDKVYSLAKIHSINVKKIQKEKFNLSLNNYQDKLLNTSYNYISYENLESLKKNFFDLREKSKTKLVNYNRMLTEIEDKEAKIIHRINYNSSRVKKILNGTNGSLKRQSLYLPKIKFVRLVKKKYDI